MAKAMEVSPKTENEECAGKTLQIRGSEGGRRVYTGTCPLGITWRVSRKPSARLTHGLELAIEVWRLRCSVFGETSMAFFCSYFKKLNCYSMSLLPFNRGMGSTRWRLNQVFDPFAPKASARISEK